MIFQPHVLKLTDSVQDFLCLWVRKDVAGIQVAANVGQRCLQFQWPGVQVALLGIVRQLHGRLLCTRDELLHCLAEHVESFVKPHCMVLSISGLPGQLAQHKLF